MLMGVNPQNDTRFNLAKTKKKNIDIHDTKYSNQEERTSVLYFHHFPLAEDYFAELD